VKRGTSLHQDYSKFEKDIHGIKIDKLKKDFGNLIGVKAFLPEN
jgi:hypothetical protein